MGVAVPGLRRPPRRVTPAPHRATIAPEALLHAEKLQMSEAEYLTRSPGWELRHEWIDGEAWAMAGGSPLHAAVIANVIAAATLCLRGTGCRVSASDQRVRVEATGNYFYPDVTVVCGPYRRSDADADSIVNPRVLIEVLSPSTADFDFGRKFDNYRQLPSLTDVLLIDPERPHVVHLARTEEGWLRRDLHEGSIVLRGVDALALHVDDVYADLDAVRG